MNITIHADETERAARQYVERVNRADLVKLVGARLLELLRRHFRDNVSKRHDTANRLKAMPTAYWGNPTTYTRFEGDTITISKPGIGRALHNVTIRPKNGRALTLPIAALAYGKRVGDLAHTLGTPIFRPKGTRILAYRDDDGKVSPLYALVSEVEQPHDPTLLPSESVTTQALQEAIRLYLATLA